MNRREFLETVALGAVVPTLARQEPANEWGSPVFDLHFHLRPQPASNLAHLDGAGVSSVAGDADSTAPVGVLCRWG